jgi:arylsulfatase
LSAKPAFGDFPDALAEMDANLGQILDAVDKLGIRDKTIVVLASDNSPEATWPWQASSGPWRGYYFTDIKDSLKVPFIVREPGRIPVGRVRNAIVHQVDTFTTSAAIAGAQTPTDRPIDGGPDRFLARQGGSIKPRAFRCSWRTVSKRSNGAHWKMVFYDEERDSWTPLIKLGEPKVFYLSKTNLPTAHWTHAESRQFLLGLHWFGQ